MTLTLTAHTLPPLPTHAADGHEWAAQLTGWHSVPAWGRDGWPLGDPPYVVIAHSDAHTHDPHRPYGLAVYCEGDVTPQAFTTRLARDLATDTLAAWLWHHNENGPHDLPDDADDLQTHHRGPARAA